MELVKKINDLCRIRGMTIASLEREAKLGNGTIRRWDKSSPSLDRVLKVCSILNVSINYLIEEEKR